jgi:hypothetical protein
LCAKNSPYQDNSALLMTWLGIRINFFVKINPKCVRFRSIFDRYYLSVFVLFSELTFFCSSFPKSNPLVDHNRTIREAQNLFKKMKNTSKTSLTVISTLSTIEWNLMRALLSDVRYLFAGFHKIIKWVLKRESKSMLLAFF